MCSSDLLAALGKGHQVFCVTHLPQVAALGHAHLVVTKTQDDRSTAVEIAPVHGRRKDRESELARMLGASEDDARAWLASAEAVGAAELAPGSSQLWRGRILLRRLGADRAEQVRLRARKIDGGRWDRLDAAQAFAGGDTCRRLALLRYFGDMQEPIATGRCCDVCDPIAKIGRAHV